MASSLAALRNLARHEAFVGRAREIAEFRSALAGSRLPFHVMYIFGPGGVGKTALLGEFEYFCRKASTPVVRIDGRNFEPSPESFIRAMQSFIRAMQSVMGLSPHDSPVKVMASTPKRHVLLVDTYESLAPLDAWLAGAFIPQLPENVLIVLACREPPSVSWRADPSWQTLLRVSPLRYLSPDESRELLTKRGVPSEQHLPVLQFTHGHPLALSLVAEVFTQRPDTRFQPEAEPDVIKILLEQLVQRVPGPAHRRALEISAAVHVTTEGLLAEILSIPDAHELFEWLRRLTFMEAGPLGIFPHDIAREVLIVDFRWRDPDWYVEIHRRARGYYRKRLQETPAEEQQRILLDYIFLHRDNPVVRPFSEWQESGNVLVGPLRPTDESALLSMVATHEGKGSAHLAEYWLARQPQGVLVFRNVKDEPVGFMSLIALEQAPPEELKMDPATEVTWRYLEQHAPLRTGETATLYRFWMARDTYQAISPVQKLIAVNAVRHYLTTPRLAFSFLPCAEPDYWAPIFAYADLGNL